MREKVFLGLFSYSFREASMVACKMGVKEVREVGVVSDMVASRGLGSECMMLAGDRNGA